MFDSFSATKETTTKHLQQKALYKDDPARANKTKKYLRHKDVEKSQFTTKSKDPTIT